MTMIWLGLFSGIAFGFVVQRVGATDAHRMARSHLMLDADIPRFMLLAVVLSAVGLFGLQSVGVGRVHAAANQHCGHGIGGGDLRHRMGADRLLPRYYLGGRR